MKVETYKHPDLDGHRVILVTLSEGETHEWCNGHFRSFGPGHVRIIESPESGTNWLELDLDKDWYAKEIEELEQKGWRLEEYGTN